MAKKKEKKIDLNHLEPEEKLKYEGNGKPDFSEDLHEIPAEESEEGICVS